MKKGWKIILIVAGFLLTSCTPAENITAIREKSYRDGYAAGALDIQKTMTTKEDGAYWEGYNNASTEYEVRIKAFNADVEKDCKDRVRLYRYTNPSSNSWYYDDAMNEVAIRTNVCCGGMGSWFPGEPWPPTRVRLYGSHWVQENVTSWKLDFREHGYYAAHWVQGDNITKWIWVVGEPGKPNLEKAIPSLPQEPVTPKPISPNPKSGWIN